MDHTPPSVLIVGDSSGEMVGGKAVLSTRPINTTSNILPTDHRFRPVTAIHPTMFNGVRIRHQHSSRTELFGALFLIALAVTSMDLEDTHVKYLGDNTTAKAYINRLGGRMRAHCRILRPFLDLFRLKNIRISMGYRSGTKLILWGVDGLSRQLDMMPHRDTRGNELEITAALRA